MAVALVDPDEPPVAVAPAPSPGVELAEPVAPGRLHPKSTIIQASKAQTTVGHDLTWDRIPFSSCRVAEIRTHRAQSSEMRGRIILEVRWKECRRCVGEIL